MSVGLDPQDAILYLVTAVLPLPGRVMVVALGFVVAWRWLHRPGGPVVPERRTNPFELLDARYARGEIDTAQYDAAWRRPSGKG